MQIIYFILAGAILGGLYGFMAYKKQNKASNKK